MACYIAFAIGLIFMVCFHIFVYQNNTISAYEWMHRPPLGPNIRDQDKMAGISSLIFMVLLFCQEQFLQATRAEKIRQCAIMLGLAISFAFVIWSAGRNTLLALGIITFIFLSIATIKRHRLLQKLPSFMLSIMLAITLSASFSVYEFNGFHRIISQFNIEKTQQTPNLSDTEKQAALIQNYGNGRIPLWKATIAAIKTSPLSGHGPYGYYYIKNRVHDDQPHNFILQFMIEWGLLGTIPMLIMLSFVWAYILKNLNSKLQDRDCLWLISASLVVYLSLTGLLAGTFFKIQPFTLLTLALAHMLACLLRPDRKQSKPQNFST